MVKSKIMKPKGFKLESMTKVLDNWSGFLPLVVPSRENTPPSSRNQTSSLDLKVTSIKGYYLALSLLDTDSNIPIFTYISIVNFASWICWLKIYRYKVNIGSYGSKYEWKALLVVCYYPKGIMDKVSLVSFKVYLALTPLKCSITDDVLFYLVNMASHNGWHHPSRTT